jgi:glucose/arabinose dehydrogenase
MTGACNGDPASTGEPPEEAGGIRLETVATGLSGPVFLTSPPGDPRLFVVELPGRIRVIVDGEVLPASFLDITDRVGSGGERGLLGLAFPQDYASSGEFVVHYTDLSGDTKVERYRAASDPDVADPGSGRQILALDQPFTNHNGGQVSFGPDGMLYIALGDGGSGGDPQGNGQNTGTLLGSILRLDITAEPYTIPPDNPFAGAAGARGEIWAWGLRNPWRFAFDDADGRLYIADVGQNQYEEINVADASAGGLNYGWNIMEATHCFTSSSCSNGGLTLPVLEYSHAEGCSITGGFVYRGSSLPEVVGHYFYSDYCSGWIRSFRMSGGKAIDRRDWGLDAGGVLSFGVDAAGELYVLNADGVVHRLAPSH